MTSRYQIELDVAVAMRKVITSNETPITSGDPDIDKRGYHVGLIPGAPRWDGWNASDRAWTGVLDVICVELRGMRTSYEGFSVSLQDSEDTRMKPLTETRALLIERIETWEAENA